MDNYQHLKSLQSTRKRFEQMNQTLISRVSFLESEDIKARKMIEETKKQAAKLSKSKTQHLEEQKTLETVIFADIQIY